MSEHKQNSKNTTETDTVTDEEYLYAWTAERKISAAAIDKLFADGFTPVEAMELVETRKVPNGLIAHPDGRHIIYPVGSVVVIEDVSSNQQELLQGHTNYIKSIAVSRDGSFIASGETTEIGLKACAIVWDVQSKEEKYKLVLHRGCVQALAFSSNNVYIATLGGQDDGLVVLWDMKDGSAMCSAPAQNNSAGNTLCVAFSNTCDFTFITGGEGTLRVWDIDTYDSRLLPVDVKIGHLKRTVQCIEVDESEDLCYCGTTTGDVLVINTDTMLFQYRAPQRKLFESGVTALAKIKPGILLVGTGCGNLHEFRLLYEGQKPKIMRSWRDGQVKSTSDAAITSVGVSGRSRCFIGTRNSHVYSFKCMDSFETIEPIKTCHSSRINGLVFPLESSKLFVTCQKEQVRIWLTSNMKELAHFAIPKATCNAVDIAKDGNFILSGWDDGFMRVLIPTTMRVATEMKDAHTMGVTAIACTWNNRGIVSGGREGQLRLWKYTHGSRFDPIRLLSVMKEHRATVSDIKISRNDEECVSASEDGTCVVWDLINQSRKQILHAATLFKSVAYSSDDTQILTTGTDRRITYWEVEDGNLVRELDGSKAGTVNALDVSADGRYFVSGGDDRLLKVWNYDEGEVVKVGTRLTGGITCVRMSPDGKTVISASDDGAVLIWKLQHNG